MRRLTAFASLCLLPLSVSADANISLQTLMNTELTDDVRTKASTLRYVFVAGFLNEAMRALYFKDNIEVLEEAGVPENQIHVLFPPSGKAAEENAIWLRSELQKIYQLGKQKLILLGHSKGGMETLLVALQDPAFIERNVEMIFLVQAALGGSGVADAILAKDAKMDDRMPAVQAGLFKKVIQAGGFLENQINAGLLSLGTAQSKQLWQNFQPAIQRLSQAVQSKILYIRTQEHPVQVAGLINCAAWYLKTYFGQNDGLLVIDDQKLAGVGRDLDILEADHADLTVSFPISNEPEEFRHRFTRGLLHTIQLLSPVSEGTFPQRVMFRTRYESFNATYYFVARGGMLWFKPNVERTGVDGPWQLAPVPSDLVGRVQEISSDDEYVLVLDRSRRVWTMFDGHKGPKSWDWKKKWGAPLWLGRGINVPSPIRSWDISFFSPREDKYLLDKDGVSRSFVGVGVTTLYYLSQDGKKITYLDPWLPNDHSYEVCGPFQGGFVSKTMSATGSTIAVMNEFGDIYTRLYDFDISGGDTVFFRYHPTKPVAPIRFDRLFPAPGWKSVPKILLENGSPASITDRITLFKHGEGGVFRTLRVEGRDQFGRTGYWEYEVQTRTLPQGNITSAWTFHFTGHALAGNLISNSPTVQVSKTYSEPKFYRYSGSVENYEISVPDFIPACAPFTLQVRAKGQPRNESFSLVIHAAETVRQKARNPGMSDKPINLSGYIMISDEMRASDDPAIQDFLKNVLGGSEHPEISMDATVDQLVIDAPGKLDVTLVREN